MEGTAPPDELCENNPMRHKVERNQDCRHQTERFVLHRFRADPCMDQLQWAPSRRGNAESNGGEEIERRYAGKVRLAGHQ
jgi:hypothetical protein